MNRRGFVAALFGAGVANEAVEAFPLTMQTKGFQEVCITDGVIMRGCEFEGEISFKVGGDITLVGCSVTNTGDGDGAVIEIVTDKEPFRPPSEVRKGEFPSAQWKMLNGGEK